MSIPDPQQRLLDRAVADDRTALVCLLAQQRARLIRYFAQHLPTDLRRVIDADDLVQQTYVRVFKNMQLFEARDADSFGRWVITIGRNQMLAAIESHNAAKRGGGRRAMGDGDLTGSMVRLLERVAVTEHTPSRSAAGHEAVAMMQAAMAGLREDDQTVLRLRYLEGLTVSETAERMGRTEGACQVGRIGGLFIDTGNPEYGRRWSCVQFRWPVR